MKEASPLLIFQALSVITSQYYLNNIYSELKAIKNDIQQINKDKIIEHTSDLEAYCDRLLQFAKSDSQEYKDEILRISTECLQKKKFFLNKLKSHINIKHEFRENEELKNTFNDNWIIPYFGLFYRATLLYIYAEYLLFRLTSPENKSIHIENMNNAYRSLNDGEREIYGRRAEFKELISICKEKSLFEHASIDNLGNIIENSFDDVEKDAKEKKRIAKQEVMKVPIYIKNKCAGQYSFCRELPKNVTI